MEDFIVEKDGKLFIDVVKILPDTLPGGKKILWKDLDNKKIELYVPVLIPGRGHDSKKVVVNRLIELDNLFFEGLGLWQGEGGKGKGLYFGNNCIEILFHFLKFANQKLGISRKEFKATINIPEPTQRENKIKNKWSKELEIPIENFTNICIDEGMNKEYVQVYYNGIVLFELMNNFHEKLKPIIIVNKNFCAAYLRGIIAAESQVALKKWGTIAYVAISTIDEKMIEFYRKCLKTLDINSFTYQLKSRKFPIYGKRNLEKLGILGLLDLHPDKKTKFENGLKNYKREVMKSIEMEELVLNQLRLGPKTYDDISKALKKGRSTIQSHYIPLLESRGLIKRCGKRKQAWLFSLS